MERNVEESYVNRKVRSTILAIIIHALIPLFWIVFIMFILPQFFAIFLEMNAPLPLLTRIAFKACSIISHFWYLSLFVFFWILVA